MIIMGVSESWSLLRKSLGDMDLQTLRLSPMSVIVDCRSNDVKHHLPYLRVQSQSPSKVPPFST